MASPVLGLSLREALALGVRPPLAALRVRCLGVGFSSAPSPVVALSLREALPLGVRRLSSALIVRGLSGFVSSCRHCRSSTILMGSLSVLHCRALS